MANRISNADLDALLAEVGTEIDESLAKNEKLAKAKEDGADDESSGPPSAPAGDAAGSAPPGADAPPGGEASAGAAAPAGAAPAAPGGDAPPDGAPGADPAGGQAPADPQAIQDALSALPVEQIKIYYLAAKAALMQKMGGGAGAAGAPPAGPDAGGSAPPAGPAGPAAGPSPSPAGPPAGPAASPSAPPGPPAASPDDALKAEMKSVPANGGLAKSESDKKIEDLTGQVEGLTKAVKILLETPSRKAIAGVSELPGFLAKTEADKPGTADAKPLTRPEILAKLNVKAEDPTLAKNDRTLINKFCVGQADVSQISHLLK